MLKGQAKTDYQREYMRKRRAQAAKPAWEPTQAMLDKIARWVRKGCRTGSLGQEVLADLDFTGEPEEWMEACYRLRDIRAFRREKREEEQRERDRPRVPTCCWCGETPPETRTLVQAAGIAICEECIDRAAGIVAEARAARAARE
jgi:hypothetical protein